MSKRKKQAPAAPAPRKRKRKSPAKRKRSSAPRKRSSSHRRAPKAGSGLKFEVERIKLDRQGYDKRGRHWGRTPGQKLYSVRVIDKATDIYQEAMVRAGTVAEAKADIMASMMRSLSSSGGKELVKAVHAHQRAKRQTPSFHHTTHFAGDSGPMGAINLEAATDAELNRISMDGRAHSSYRQLAALYLRARAARLAGDIDKAMRFERDADYVYERLPHNLKW